MTKILAETESLCPQCLQRIPAFYREVGGKVYLEKICPEHGEFSTLFWENAASFLRWQSETKNVAPKASLTESEKGCPFDCGPCPNHQQTACCVLLDVTMRCNQKCPFCFASANEDPAADPPLAQIGEWYDRLRELGEARPFNIQLSGGEPTVRKDLPAIIAMGREKGFTYIQLNSNGRRLALEKDYAKQLRAAGLSVVFLQFDGTNDDIYLRLRGEKLFALKLAAIENCAAANLPVTLVPTVTPAVNVDNIGAIFAFMLDHMPYVRGIHFQPVSYFGRYPEAPPSHGRVTLYRIMKELEKQTGGKIRREDLSPLQTGHSLCCFHGAFLREGDEFRVLKGPKTCSCCSPSPEEIIAKDRDFVLNKWALPRETSGCDGEEDGFDRVLRHLREDGFTLTGMAFQDVWNLDLNRLAKCRVHVWTKEEKLIPFCAYQMTNREGQGLYRR